MKYVQNDEIINVYRYLNAVKNAYGADTPEYKHLRTRVFDHIFKSVSYLPTKVAGRYSKFADREDLLQIGKYALYRAIRTFDCTKGNHFFSWSYLWLVKSIKIEAHRQRRYKETFPTKDMNTLESLSKSVVDTETLYNERLNAYCIDVALKGTSETYSKILRMSFGIGAEMMSLRDIGKEVGKSHEWVRTARARALDGLKRNKYIAEAAL